MEYTILVSEKTLKIEGVTVRNTRYTMRDKTFWHIIISLALASCFIFASMYAAQPILPLFTTQFDISVSVSSLAMSGTTLSLIIGLIVIGFWSDQKGRTAFIKISILTTSIIVLIIPFLNDFIWIILLRFIQGFTMSGIVGAALAYIAEEIEPKYVAFATTLYIAANSVGGMLGRFVIGYLAEVKTWEFAFFLLAIMGFVIFIYVILSLPASKQFESPNKKFAEEFKTFFVHFKNKALLLMFGLGLIIQVSFTGMWTYLPFHLLGEPFQLSIGQISFFYFAYSFGIVGAPIAGFLVGKFSMRGVRVFGICLLSLGMVTVLIQKIVFIIIGLSLICLGFFVTHSIAATTVSQTATHHKGTASSLYLVAYYIGVSIGTTAFAPVWDHFAWLGIIIITAILPIGYFLIVQLSQNKSISQS